MKQKLKIILFLSFLVIVVSEILLGYRYYLNRNHNIYGNYLPASYFIYQAMTIKLDDYQTLKKYKKQDLRLKEIKVKLEKSAEYELKLFNHKNCKYLATKDVNFEISNLRAMRSPIRVGVTEAKFLNIKNFDDKYLISFSGNSEGLGIFTSLAKNRIFQSLEKKLNKKYKTNKIIVINLSNSGYTTDDMIYSKNRIRDLYPIQLEIIYTGGNEVELLPHQLINDDIKFNIINKYYYEFVNNELPARRYQECSDKNIYLSSSRVGEVYPVDNYIKDSYEKMTSNNNDGYDYLFYIHPFDQEKVKNSKEAAALELISKIKYKNKRFFNLSKLNYKTDIIDLFHTNDGSKSAEILYNDIIRLYGEKIEKKINYRNN